MDRDVESLLWLTDVELVAVRRQVIRELNLLRPTDQDAAEEERTLRNTLLAIQAVQADRNR